MTIIDNVKKNVLAVAAIIFTISILSANFYVSSAQAAGKGKPVSCAKIKKSKAKSACLKKKNPKASTIKKIRVEKLRVKKFSK